MPVCLTAFTSWSVHPQISSCVQVGIPVIKDKQLLEVRADQQYSADQASNGTSADNSHSLAPHFVAF